MNELLGTELFDIMLISSKIRGSDGFELIKFARSLNHRKRILVLMVTGTPGMETEAFQSRR